MKRPENVRGRTGVNVLPHDAKFRTDPPAALDTLVGVLKGFDANGQPLVVVPSEADHTIPARSCVPLRPDHVGSEVVVVLEGGALARPIVLGVICATHGQPQNVDLDGDHVSLDATESITLRCGHASITLSKDGKVTIRGAHVVSQAAGVNRIKGGSVQLN